MQPAHFPDLAGKRVVVTGATRGLGRAMARGFAAAGCDLVVVGRKPATTEAAAEQLAGEFGVRALGVAADVGRWADLDVIADRAHAGGAVDVLVNNVGMSPLYPSLVEVTEQLYDKVLNVNLRSTFRLSALFGTRMAAGAGGAIINVSSIAAVRPLPTALPYAAAKAGVNNLTEGLAASFGPTVRVNCIMAGPFATDASKDWTDEIRSMISATVALGRLGRPEEVVAAALYLGSSASSFTTGTVLGVHGGIP